MRILILNTDYARFLDRLYRDSPGLENQPYDAQLSARNATLFGLFDVYSRCFQAAGHQAWEIHANNETMQKQWARERGANFGPSRHGRSIFRDVLTRVPRLGRRFRRVPTRESWFLGVLAAQIATYRPDVILNQDVYLISGRFLAEAMGGCGLVVGQIASPLPPQADWQGYDLMISSLPNLVDHFKELGLAAEWCPLGFDSTILERLTPAPERDIPILFVGSFSSDHQRRIDLLERLCLDFDIEIWGSGLAALKRNSPIRPRVRGEAWGADMYRLLGRAQIALNQHIDMAGDYANNCRLFEATGMGALLLTDWKANLNEYFAVGTEVLGYSSADECRTMIARCLAEPTWARRVAEAGRRRTLSSHAYGDRMRHLASVFERHLAKAPRPR